MKKYREVESYAHYYTKEVLKKWLVSKWDKTKLAGSYDIFDWNANFQDKDRGIKLEYPILTFKNKYLGMDLAWNDYPDLEKAIDSGRKVGCVIDMVILSDGKPKYGIEVVHTHPCSKSKLALLKILKEKYNFIVYEISSWWVLNQIRRPSNMGLCLKLIN